MELYELRCAAKLRVWGLKRSVLPDTEFFKETAAEALCSELDGRLKQAFFAYATALDAQINFALTELMSLSALGETARRLKLEDKLSTALEWSTGRRDLGGDPLATAIKSRFAALVDRRNVIAHSLKAAAIKQAELEDAVFLFLVLSMVLETKSLDMGDLTRAFDLKAKVKEKDRLPSREDLD